MFSPQPFLKFLPRCRADLIMKFSDKLVDMFLRIILRKQDITAFLKQCVKEKY